MSFRVTPCGVTQELQLLRDNLGTLAGVGSIVAGFSFAGLIEIELPTHVRTPPSPATTTDHPCRRGCGCCVCKCWRHGVAIDVTVWGRIRGSPHRASTRNSNRSERARPVGPRGRVRSTITQSAVSRPSHVRETNDNHGHDHNCNDHDHDHNRTDNRNDPDHDHNRNDHDHDHNRTDNRNDHDHNRTDNRNEDLVGHPRCLAFIAYVSIGPRALSPPSHPPWAIGYSLVTSIGQRL